MSQEVRIVIADDHPIVRKGLRDVIQEESGFQVVGEAADGEASLAQTPYQRLESHDFLAPS